MEYVAVIFVIIIVVVVLVFLKQKGESSAGKLPYISKGTLFSKAERSFYGVLKQVVGNDYEVFGQVRVADVLAIKKGLGKGERQGYFNKIKAKHVDFLLCNPKDLSIVAAIELDDKSHSQPKRMERDKFLNKAFEDAAVPLIRFKVKSSYTRGDIEEELQKLVKTGMSK